MEYNTLISVTSLSMGFVLMALSLIAIYLCPYMGRTKAFVILATVGGTFMFATYFIYSLGGVPGVVILLIRLQVTLLVLYMVGLLHITLMLPFEGDISSKPIRTMIEFLRRPINIYAIGVVLGMVPAALVMDLREGPGLEVDMGYAWPVLAAYAVILVAIMTYVMVMSHRSGDDSGSTEERTLVMMSVLAFFIAWLASMIIAGTEEVTQIINAGVGVLASSTIMAVLVIRHPRQIVRPIAESTLMATTGTDEDVEVEGCRCLLVESKDSEAAFRIFKNRLSEGSLGLIIARTHPNRIREERGLVDTPMIWLASQPGPDRIDPTNLSILQNTILDFIRRGDRIVILVEGLEYLVSNNPVEKVLKTLYLIKDEIMFKEGQVVNGSRDMMLIIPLDIDVMSERDLALFEREFEIVQVRGEYEG